MTHFPVPKDEFYFLGLIRSEFRRIRRSLTRHKALWRTPDHIHPDLAKQAEHAYRRNVSFVGVAAHYLQTMPDGSLAPEANTLAKMAPALIRAITPFIAQARRASSWVEPSDRLTLSPVQDAVFVARKIKETTYTALIGNDGESPETPGWHTNEYLDYLEDCWEQDRRKLAHYRRQVTIWRKAPLTKRQCSSVAGVERAIAKLDRTLARIKIDHIAARTYVTQGRSRREVGDYLWSMAGPDIWETLV